MAVPDPKRFATLLRVRKHYEDGRARDLGMVRRVIAQAEDERAQMEAEQKQIFGAASERTHEVFDASDIQRYHQYARFLAKRIDDKLARVAELRQQERDRLKALRAAVQQRQIAERLDERAVEAYDTFVDTEQRKAIDETATVRAWIASNRTER